MGAHAHSAGGRRRRLLLRLLVLGVAAALLVFALRMVPRPSTTNDAARVDALMAIAPAHFKNVLPGVELLDLEVNLGSDASVAYEHDALYDVTFVYSRAGVTKRFTAPYGRKGAAWITPTSVELRSRDESALVVEPGR